MTTANLKHTWNSSHYPELQFGFDSNLEHDDDYYYDISSRLENLTQSSSMHVVINRSVEKIEQDICIFVGAWNSLSEGSSLYPFWTSTPKAINRQISFFNVKPENAWLTTEFSNFINQYVKPENAWLTTELSNFINQSSYISLESLKYLFSEIYKTYGEVKIKTVIHTDPEEGWTKPVFIIHSKAMTFDALMKHQDNLFIKAENDVKLLAILPHVIISQE